MDKEDLDELQGLVIGFLQEGIKDHPYGFSLKEFEVQYPKKTDEPLNWYSRYKKRTALEALECIGRDVIKIYNRNGIPYISLNQASDKVDQDLIGLIKGQKSSTKKRGSGFKRPSHVQANLFNQMNKRYSDSSYRNNRTTRLNYDRHMENNFIRREEPSHSNRPSFSSNSSRKATGDPRSFVPPQIKPTIPSTHVPRQSVKPPPPATVSRSSFAAESKQDKRVDDPKIAHKLDQIRQRIVYMLKKKSEIKLLFLKGHYELEFEETINPSTLGYRSITELLLSPIIQESIELVNKPPNWVMCLRCNKENVHLPSENTEMKSSAVDPFNVRNMLQSLEPLTNLGGMRSQNAPC